MLLIANSDGEFSRSCQARTQRGLLTAQPPHLQPELELVRKSACSRFLKGLVLRVRMEPCLSPEPWHRRAPAGTAVMGQRMPASFRVGGKQGCRGRARLVPPPGAEPPHTHTHTACPLASGREACRMGGLIGRKPARLGEQACTRAPGKELSQEDGGPSGCREEL